MGKWRRIFDSKPWAAHLYVTDQCNLDCHYCNEYDNSLPHPSLDDLRRWMRKIRDLGALRLGLQGGEPLMHPDIVEVIRYAKELGFAPVSMSTNGLLLTPALARGMKDAGLDKLQISVDRMTPIASTRKSLKSVAHKLDYLREIGLNIQVTGVLFEDTIDEIQDVMEHCMSRGIRAHARIAHDDMLADDGGVSLGDSIEPMLEFLALEERRKLRGDPVHTDWNTLEYQRALLRGEHWDWTCVAGYKYFFVSGTGKFWLCSQVRTDIDIMDVTADMLREHNVKKECQPGCGVYCVVDMSLVVSHPVRYVAREARGRMRELPYRLRVARKPEVGRVALPAGRATTPPPADGLHHIDVSRAKPREEVT